MDLEAFVASNGAAWARLDQLSRRRRLTGPEADELVDLYQRTATHLSIVRSTAPDPAVVGSLSSLLARARSSVTAAHTPMWSEVVTFFGRSFPAAVYRARHWWIATAAVSLGLALVLGFWVAGNPDVQATIGTPDQIRDLVENDFADYYTSNPASSWVFQLWINNAWVAASSLTLGAFLCLPGAYILLQNAANLGIIGGIMGSAGRLDVFFGLILPHGLLELTGVFVAGGAGIRLGWQLIDPGRRPRSVALAQEGRATFTIALGLVVVFLVAGAVEAFVTPSGLPTWARIGVGLAVWSAFMAWVFVLGRRAVAEGETGDLTAAYATTDVLPYAG